MYVTIYFVYIKNISIVYIEGKIAFGFFSWGRYTRAVDLPDGHEVVIPRKVRSDGSFISHQIPHHFERSFYRNRTTGDDAVHYRLRIDHEEHHVELYPNYRLLGPGAVIERRWKSQDFLNNVQLKRLRDTQCHYRARVRNQSEDSALSTCYGLVSWMFHHSIDRERLHYVGLTD